MDNSTHVRRESEEVLYDLEPVVRVGRQDVDPDRPVTNLAGRPGVPEDTAGAVLFLVSNESSFIIGQDIFADGGVMAMEIG